MNIRLIYLKTWRYISLISFCGLYYLSWNNYKLPDTPDKRSPFIFIGGVPKSGSTFLRMMLNLHPQIRIGTESYMVNRMLKTRETWELSPDEMLFLAEAGITTSDIDLAVQNVILEIMTSHGYHVKYLGDQDSSYFKYMIYLKYLLPNSKFILMIRDGRAVVHSLITRGVNVPGFDLTNQTKCLITWNKMMSEMYAHCVRVGPQICLPVYYEQLVLFPDKWMRMILDFLEIPWDSAMLRHQQYLLNEDTLSKLQKPSENADVLIQQDKTWNWAKHFTFNSTELKTIAPMLETLGYDADASPPVYVAMETDVKNNILHLTKNKYYYKQKLPNIFDKPPFNVSLPKVRSETLERSHD